MGRKKGEATDDQKSNGFTVSKTPEYVGRIENLQKQIDDVMQAAKDECAPLREEIAAVKKEANENHNIPRRELNATVRTRRLVRLANAVRGTLSADQRDNYDAMLDQFDDLDDTPLGRAARKTDGLAASTH